MGIMTLIGPDGRKVEVTTDKRPITGESLGKGQAQSYLDQGYLPQSELDANELGGMGIQVPMSPSGGPKIYNAGGVDRSGIDQARKTTDYIMEDYREYGADNPYMKEYGEDNPYMDKALANIGELEDMSKSTDPTQYANALLDKQDLIKTMQMEDMTKGNSSDMATSYSNMAQSGGLDSGQRERMMTSGNRNMMMGRQRVGSSDALARGGILANDASYKQDLRTQIPGMYNPYAQGQEAWTQGRATGYENWADEKNKFSRTTTGNLYAGGQ